MFLGIVSVVSSNTEVRFELFGSEICFFSDVKDVICPAGINEWTAAVYHCPFVIQRSDFCLQHNAFSFSIVVTVHAWFQNIQTGIPKMYHSNNNHAEKSLAHNPTVLHTFINGGNSWNFLWQLFLKCSGWPFTLRHGHHVRIGENPWNVFTVGRHWDYRRHFDLSTGRVGIKITGPTDEVGRPSKKEQVLKKWDGSVAQLSLLRVFFFFLRI